MSIGRTPVALDTQSPGVSRDVSRPSPGDAPALRAWALARDAVLRGLVHALSNRVGTVAAVAGMLESAEGDGASAESVGVAARILAGEGERMEALLAQFRLATTDSFGADAAPEPVHVLELLAEVATLAAVVGWEVGIAGETGGGDTPPAMVGRAPLAHALLVLLHAARGGVAEAPVLAAAREGVAVRLWVASGTSRAPVPVPPDVLGACAWLLGAAAVRAGDGRAELWLPALGGG